MRESGRRTDPGFEADLERTLSRARPMMEHSLKALSAAMPAIMQSLDQAGQALERATANMPSPTYPKR